MNRWPNTICGKKYHLRLSQSCRSTLSPQWWRMKPTAEKWLKLTLKNSQNSGLWKLYRCFNYSAKQTDEIWIISLLTWRHQTCSCTHVNLYRSKQTMADRTWSPCLTDRMDCRGHFVRALSFLPRSLNSCVDSKPGYRFNKKVQTHSASNPPRNHHAKTI